MTTKRTPGPWTHVARKGGWDGINSEDGQEICSLNLNNPENAAFIVRAVNAYDEMLSALKLAYKIIRGENSEGLPAEVLSKSIIGVAIKAAEGGQS